MDYKLILGYNAFQISLTVIIRAEVLMKAIKEFISDFHTTDLSSGTSRSSIGISFIDQLKPNLNFLTKCRPFIKSEACIIGSAMKYVCTMIYH